mmetsp:Transcript_11580/g.20868  ORF Transcript_11580/g.20868 Transcript_11580/m.20868 type:complete len:237 (+) Transcript_11580:974-1684(+)
MLFNLTLCTSSSFCRSSASNLESSLSLIPRPVLLYSAPLATSRRNCLYALPMSSARLIRSSKTDFMSKIEVWKCDSTLSRSSKMSVHCRKEDRYLVAAPSSLLMSRFTLGRPLLRASMACRTRRWSTSLACKIWACSIWARSIKTSTEGPVSCCSSSSSSACSSSSTSSTRSMKSSSKPSISCATAAELGRDPRRFTTAEPGREYWDPFPELWARDPLSSSCSSSFRSTSSSCGSP